MLFFCLFVLISKMSIPYFTIGDASRSLCHQVAELSGQPVAQLPDSAASIQFSGWFIQMVTVRLDVINYVAPPRRMCNVCPKHRNDFLITYTYSSVFSL
jgi:hypothetical protein